MLGKLLKHEFKNSYFEIDVYKRQVIPQSLLDRADRIIE